MRVAGAPISWGVIEVPDWGYQMPAERLLAEAASVGLRAMESGPDGFLPDEPERVREMLSKHGLDLVGGFVPAVLHDPARREAGLETVERRAKSLAGAGADTLVLAAATESDDYAGVVELDDAAWRELFENLRRAEEVCAAHGLRAVLHSHFGTVVETDEQVRRFLDGSEMDLCLDTGHLVIGGSDPVAIAREASGRIGHVHLKDVGISLAKRLTDRELDFREACRERAFRPLGEGDVDVAGLLEVLGGSGYDGWYVLEQDCLVTAEPPEGEGPITDLKKSLDFVDSVRGVGEEGR